MANHHQQQQFLVNLFSNTEMCSYAHKLMYIHRHARNPIIYSILPNFNKKNLLHNPKRFSQTQPWMEKAVHFLFIECSPGAGNKMEDATAAKAVALVGKKCVFVARFFFGFSRCNLACCGLFEYELSYRVCVCAHSYFSISLGHIVVLLCCVLFFFFSQTFNVHVHSMTKHYSYEVFSPAIAVAAAPRFICSDTHLFVIKHKRLHSPVCRCCCCYSHSLGLCVQKFVSLNISFGMIIGFYLYISCAYGFI